MATTDFKDDPFWMSKMKYQFQSWFDLNGSGSIENDDFNKLFDSMVAAKNGERKFDINLFREMTVGFNVSMGKENPGNIFGEMLVKLTCCETEFERTEFWEEKHRHQFNVWFDQDGYGFVEKEDFHQHAKNIIALTKWAEGSPKWQRCNDVMRGLWRELKRGADTNFNNKVTVDEYLNFMEYMCREIKAKTMKIPYWYGSYFDLYFDVIDSLGNGDGLITEDAFVSAYRPFKIPDDVIEKCFNEMTYGGRIAMDRDYWNLCSIQFLHSTDINSPGNILGKMLTGKYD
ncbi:unnamed protein product [Owenia fusiformis]|uniref:Uncharacterized protein n=1 Tax=Owenia fusiformis TaxID=6347 RepID=A0A8S4PI91_OWEFU|nr:unnamed protein product [Owenia fusiformis]